MAQSDGDDRRLIAAEYVLGTLRGAARRRFARLIERDAEARAQVEEWERRLNTLAESVPEIAPPESLWGKIERGIEDANPVQIVWRSVAFWRGFSAVATAAAAALLAILIQSSVPEPPDIPNLVAVLADSAAKPAFLVRADFDARRVNVEPLRAHERPPGADYELWLVSKPEVKEPESLGVMVVERKASIALTEKQFETLRQAIAMAVSVEPLGGSPTGAPTGELRFQGDLIPARY